MNKLLYILILLTTIACSSGDDSVTPVQNEQGTNDPGNGNGGGGTGNQNPPPADPDGDGVESAIELTDNTDPQDPCSFLLSSQDYSTTSQDWKDLDCDGDGVINGDEVDPDGNGQDEGNGTNPQELCSFEIADQTVEPSSQWNTTDCDEDCQNNSVEKRFGTNPLDPADRVNFDGRITSAFFGDTYYYLDNNGLQIDYVFSEPWYENRYQYQDDKLSETVASDTNAGIIIHNFDFFYSGDTLNHIVYYDGIDINLVYDANTITADHQFAPPAQVATRLELDPISGRVVRQEKFSGDYDEDFGFTVTEFQYDENMENLLEANIEKYTYNSNTDEFVLSTSYTETFTYHEDVMNPFYESYSSLELHSRLSKWEDYTGWSFGILSSFLPLDATFSKNLLASHSTPNGTTTYETNTCAAENGYPFLLTILSGNYSQDIIFNYAP